MQNDLERPRLTGSKTVSQFLLTGGMKLGLYPLAGVFMLLIHTLASGTAFRPQVADQGYRKVRRLSR